MLRVDQVIEGEVEAIAFGGEGILRYRGFVIFIPFTAVGDRIVCRITDIKNSFAKAVLIELTFASHDREKPLALILVMRRMPTSTFKRTSSITI